jgi:hypothetical protein
VTSLMPHAKALHVWCEALKSASASSKTLLFVFLSLLLPPYDNLIVTKMWKNCHMVYRNWMTFCTQTF